MSLENWEEDMQDLQSAEDFLDFFGVAFDPHVVRVNRLHILQRFHDNLVIAEDESLDEHSKFHNYKQLLTVAYEAFVHSTPKAEKVLRVYQTLPDQPAFVPLSALSMQTE